MDKGGFLYYSALKRKKQLIPTTTWINLKCTVLSERSQTQSFPIVIPCIRHCGKGITMMMKKDQVSPGVWKGFDYKG